MKRLIIIIVAILLTTLTLVFLQKQNITQSPQTSDIIPSVSLSPSNPTQSILRTCITEDLIASITLEGAAGSVYARAKLKNTSGSPCLVQTNNFITTQFSSDIQNIQVTRNGTPQQESYELKPNQVLSAQIRYPNGPQCSTQLKQTQVRFTYEINTGQEITFQDQQKKDTFVIQTCSSPQEITTITVSPFTIENQ